jgi:NAD(P)-dependent dehydrogenase (short-subunit alcohol dehydrogenase family)
VEFLLASVATVVVRSKLTKSGQFFYQQKNTGIFASFVARQISFIPRFTLMCLIFLRVLHVFVDGYSFAVEWQSILEWRGLQGLGKSFRKKRIITGGNTGIGYETAKSLAMMGARVTLACRDQKRGEHAVAKLREETNSFLIDVLPLDLASLRSIREFADLYQTKNPQLNILINNAGVMRTPGLLRTADGFEMQIGVNHIGHFYLTNLLLPQMIHTASKNSGETYPCRVVNVASLAHTRGTIDLEDLNWNRRKYNTGDAYSQSKLANVLFTNELNKQVESRGVMSVSLHPGEFISLLNSLYFEWVW